MPRSLRSRVARWWPAPLGVGLIAYGCCVQDPFAFGSRAFELAVFSAAGALLLLEAARPSSLGLRVVGLGATLTAMLGRAAVLLLNVDTLGWARALVGVLVWLLFAYVVTVLVLLTEFALGPKGRTWRQD